MNDYPLAADNGSSFQQWTALIAGTCLAVACIAILAGMAVIALTG